MISIRKSLPFRYLALWSGRYDEDYENRGIDYPLAYVRWTQKRNFETILQSISSGALDVKSLITEEVDLENYKEIYGDMRKQGSIASIIRFPVSSENKSTVIVSPDKEFAPSNGKMGIIGAGNFTSATLLPALIKAQAKIKYIASAGGLSAKTLAKKQVQRLLRPIIIQFCKMMRWIWY